MYGRTPRGWMKHWDFILIDFLCMEAALFLGYIIRHGWRRMEPDPAYVEMAVVLTFLEVFVGFFNESYKNILKRGYFEEWKATVKHVILIVLFMTLYLFIVKESSQFSRATLLMMGLLFGVFSYACRVLRKGWLYKRKDVRSGKRALLVVTSSDRAEEVLQNLADNNFANFMVTGLVLTDAAQAGERICDIPIVTDMRGAAEYIRGEWVDAVFISLRGEEDFKQKLMKACQEMGVTAHVELAKIEREKNGQIVERLGGYAVLSSSIRVVSNRQMFFKRALDIIGGIVGCVLMLLAAVFVGPFVYIKSPGPIIFSQIRVGRGGKRFRLYKFRSMYPDAEERKKELERQNAVSGGYMFKLEDDPRIIGGRKGIGGFIRSTSIDELPQFWNVLKGDMSLVGTRPPTVDEWEKYELHHRARLAIKPGITGLWQISGRSDITDFEEVVRLDTQYIQDWKFSKDIRILLKTVGVVLRGRGAR